ncbi:MAG: hypothetical protein WCP45_11380, partial [Verrucomicrobiota bacterium]
MKTRSNKLTGLLRVAVMSGGLSLTSLTAQNPAVERAGFVRLVNTVAQGSDKLQLLIDGEVINPDGYKLGDVTGGIGLKPGAHQITLRRPGVNEGNTRLTVAADSTITLIPFAEWVAATDDT